MQKLKRLSSFTREYVVRVLDVIACVIYLLLQLCSVELDCQRGAVMAATLANSGRCPTTGTKVNISHIDALCLCRC